MTKRSPHILDAIITLQAWSVGGRVSVQVFRREFHTHIYLDLARVKFYIVKEREREREREREQMKAEKHEIDGID